MIIPSPHSIVNSIRMKRINPLFKDKAYLIVEGCGDVNLFSTFIDENKCGVKRTGKRDKVIEVIEIADSSHCKGILGIIDADFDELNNIVYSSENIIQTDTHDIETLIIKSPAFDKLLRVQCDIAKLREFEDRNNSTIREIILEKAKFIALYRLIALNEGVKMKFRYIPFSNFLDPNTLEVDENELLNSITSTSPNFDISDLPKVQNKYNKMKTGTYNLWMLCNGHDLVKIIQTAIVNIFGIRIRNINFSTVGSFLQLSFEFRHFKDTRIYSSTKDWENNNIPFSIFF